MSTPRDSLDGLLQVLVSHRLGPRKWDLPKAEIQAIRRARLTIRQQALRIADLELELERKGRNPASGFMVARARP